MTVEAIPQEAALRLQLACIGGNEPATSYFELRPLARDGRPAPSERAFLPVRELTGAIERVRELAPRLNVYVGAAPRVRQDGTAGAVERVWCLWADLDGRDALRRLRDFRPLPSIVVRSGSDDCAHAYWPLRRSLEPSWAQRANRRLTQALGGDWQQPTRRASCARPGRSIASTRPLARLSAHAARRTYSPWTRSLPGFRTVPTTAGQGGRPHRRHFEGAVPSTAFCASSAARRWANEIACSTGRRIGSASEPTSTTRQRARSCAVRCLRRV